MSKPFDEKRANKLLSKQIDRLQENIRINREMIESIRQQIVTDSDAIDTLIEIKKRVILEKPDFITGYTELPEKPLLDSYDYPRFGGTSVKTGKIDPEKPIEKVKKSLIISKKKKEPKKSQVKTQCAACISVDAAPQHTCPIRLLCGSKKTCNCCDSCRKNCNDRANNLDHIK